jgi:hypothetical protein
VACSCQTIGGVDGGECDQSFVVTWPSDVDRLKHRLGPIVEGLAMGVESCPELGADDRRAWGLFLTEWRTFAARSTPFFGSYAEWVQACSYARTIDGWREKIAATRCNVPGPAPIKGSDATVIKWVAAAVVVAGVVMGVRAVVRR